MPTKKSLTIVLTGATRGLGRAMVTRFIELGHTVVACGRNATEVANLQKQFGKPHDFAVVDVSTDTSVATWAKRIISEHGAPDLLLNNAAVVNRNAPLWEVPAEEFDNVTAVNINGVAKGKVA